tara:strand:- start:331 stop:738 length:408 start_codon:yes stop_codon:yes gene_type:complete
MILTRELIEKHASSCWTGQNGTTCVAITKKQALALDLGYPLKKGWLTAIEDIEITSDQFNSFCNSNIPLGKQKYFSVEATFDKMLEELTDKFNGSCQICGNAECMPVSKSERNILHDHIELLCADCIHDAQHDDH